MTYQLHINHYRSQRNDSQIWNLFHVFLGVLILATLAAAFNVIIPMLSLVNVMLSVIFLVALLRIYIKRSKVAFIQIYDDSLDYFCQEEGQMISVAAKDITEISTRFCELRLHTPEKIHSLNMRLVREEQTRWEVKEMIKKLTRTDQLPKAG